MFEFSKFFIYLFVSSFRKKNFLLKSQLLLAGIMKDNKNFVDVNTFSNI